MAAHVPSLCSRPFWQTVHSHALYIHCNSCSVLKVAGPGARQLFTRHLGCCFRLLSIMVHEEPVCAEPKLFIGGLRFDIGREDIFNHFSQYGQIKTCVLLKHQDTGKSKGCAMVLYSKWANAEAAVNTENGTASNLSGPRQLIVKFADPQRRQEDGVLVGVTPKKLFVGQVLCRVLAVRSVD